MSGWARAGLVILGLVLLLPGACSAFVLLAAPAVLTTPFAMVWLVGAGLGAFGVYLLMKSGSG